MCLSPVKWARVTSKDRDGYVTRASMFFPGVAQGWNYRIVLIARAPGGSREQKGMESEEGDSTGKSQRLSVEVTAPPEGPGDCLPAFPREIANELLPFLVAQFPHLTSQEEVRRLWIQRDSYVCHLQVLQLWSTLSRLVPAPGLVACPSFSVHCPCFTQTSPRSFSNVRQAGKLHISMEIITRGV